MFSRSAQFASFVAWSGLLWAGLALGPKAADAQTHQAIFDLTDQFEGGDVIDLVNVNATTIRDQLQLDLSGIETPYLWVANSVSNEVVQMSTEDGRVLRVVRLPNPEHSSEIAIDPSRTAVDADFNCWVGYRGGDAVGRLDVTGAEDVVFQNADYDLGAEEPWWKPRGVAINADGNIWIGNWGERRIDGDRVYIDPAMRLLDPDTGALMNLTERPIRLYNPATDAPESTFVNLAPSGTGRPYGFSLDAFGNLWVAQRNNHIGQYDALTGEHVVTYVFEPTFSVDFYGIAVDIDGNVWVGNGANHNLVYLPREEIDRCEAEEAEEADPDGLCTVQGTPPGGDPTEYVQIISPPTSVDDDGVCGTGRGVAVDQSGNVWVNCFGRPWSCNASEDNSVMHVDGATLDVIGVYEVGLGPVGITATADGSVWTVNQCGGAPARPAGEFDFDLWIDHRVDYTCPNGSLDACEESGDCSGSEVCVDEGGGGECRFNPVNGGTVTQLRGSDGKVIATYPTCGTGPYTYSDMAGYNLRSVALRSGWWHKVYDAGDTVDLWQRIDWDVAMPADTEIHFRIGAGANRDDLTDDLPHEIVLNSEDGTVCIDGIEPCATPTDLTEGGLDLTSLGLQGRYLGIEVFLLTRNDFLGPIVEDVTVSSDCGVGVPEVCDGIDNDCDGYIDNDVPDGAPVPIGPGDDCETGLPGECNAGHLLCIGGGEVCVRRVNPEDEVCDEKDNDCDGRVDELVTNACGECGDPPEEVCDGDDNNCNGLTDEGVLNTCLDYDTCTTFLTCDECDAVPAEACDGVDNNCNGLIDEGEARACTDYSLLPVDPEHPERPRQVSCGLVQVCGECPDAPGEVCNGLDDNCNGLIDEGAENLCTNFGDCTTYTTCDACDATPAELCDGLDNNCDGDVDEGITNACGTCGDAPVEVCDGIDNNCDGDVDEGVTNRCGFCGEIPFEECDGIDNDCDGEVDENVANRCGGCGPEPREVCNGLDDDCDGDIDDGVANACGGCGELPLEICDGEDNDCDGDTDEGGDEYCEAELAGSVCITEAGECALPCSANECPTGKVCSDDYCITDPCIGVFCATGFICIDGECNNLCDLNNVVCEDELVCVGGRCVTDVCSNTGCGEGLICVENECVDDPCFEISCATAEVCSEGDCIDDPCATIECPESQRCDLGDCVDACEGVECGFAEICADGFCVNNSCAGVTCPDGSDCVDGNCIESACVGVVCGEGQVCQDGACLTTRVGGPCGTGLSVCGDQLVCVESICRELSDPLVADMGIDLGSTEGDSGTGEGGAGQTGSTPDEGCNCSATASDMGRGGTWLLLVGFGFLIWRRRRA